MDEKLISVLAVMGHKVIFLDQSEVHNASYSLGVISDRIHISGYVSNFIGVCHSCVTMDM